MYIYPDNMKGRSVLFLWRLRDLVFILVGAVLSVIALLGLKTVLPLVFTFTAAFVFIRFDDLCVLDYLKDAYRFCLSAQQFFLWGPGDE